MRNPQRIPEVIAALTAAWQAAPDWRLGQLVFNMAGRDPFFIEDDDMLASLQEFAKTISNLVEGN